MGLTESRYGMKSSPFFFPFLLSDAEARAAMTFPKVVSDLLILAPSFRRWPVAPVEFARSEPAKSTRLWSCYCQLWVRVRLLDHT